MPGPAREGDGGSAERAARTSEQEGAAFRILKVVSVPAVSGEKRLKETRMTEADNQKMAANYMGAVAHLLCGEAGRHDEFHAKVDILLAGSPPQLMQLWQLAGTARSTEHPLIWIHHSAELPNVPQIGIAAVASGRMHIIDSCMLWMPRSGGRARLVPGNFQMGAFRFDDQIRLQHVSKAPAASFDAGEAGMVRAYDRL